MTNDQTLLEAAKFRVVRRAFHLLDGTPHAYDLVLHPGAAVVLPIRDDGRIVMIRNRRIAVNATLLELPAGTLDAGEAPLACAQRELTEETGYTAREFTPLVSFFSSPGICTEEMHVFVARGLTAGTATPELSEELEVELLTLRQALAAAEGGAIRDAKSLLSILYYERFVQAGGRR